MTSIPTEKSLVLVSRKLSRKMVVRQQENALIVVLYPLTTNIHSAAKSIVHAKALQVACRLSHTNSERVLWLGASASFDLTSEEISQIAKLFNLRMPE